MRDLGIFEVCQSKKEFKSDYYESPREYIYLGTLNGTLGVIE